MHKMLVKLTTCLGPPLTSQATHIYPSGLSLNFLMTEHLTIGNYQKR
jgi:hypothetical protein